MKKDIRIGMIGASKIVEKAILEPSNKVTGIIPYGLAARNYERAKKFATDKNIVKVFQSYDDLITSNEIDAVYISTANYLHKEWIIKAAKMKKHILVEKPICLSVSEINEIEKAVLVNNVYLQEAVMVEHHQWQKIVKGIIDSNKFGKLVKLSTKFSFLLNKEKSNFRYHPEMGGGVFYDLGSYWVQLIQLCTNCNIEQIEAFSNFDGENGIDREFFAEVKLKSNIIAELHCSFDLPLNAEHTLNFELARLHIRNFLKPAVGKLKMSIDVFDTNDIKVDRIVLPAESYYENQLKRFVSALNSGKQGIKKETKERVGLMEAIYKNAKNKCIV